MEKNENFKSELENQYSILIRANEKKEHQRYMVFLTIILVTFFTCLLTMFFSFKAFSSTKELKDDNGTLNKVHNLTLTTTYNTGKVLKLEKITTGFELAKPKIIQITNEGNSDITFDILLNSIKTSLLSTHNLVYTITRDKTTSDAMEIPLNDKAIVQNVVIKPQQTMSFTIKVKYNGVVEGNNVNDYSANIVVEQKNNKSNLLE